MAIAEDTARFSGIPGNRDAGDVQRIALERLRLRESVREGALREDHLAAIRELGGLWPPLVVNTSCEIVDGFYRYAAAKALGLDSVEVRVFRGGAADAYIEAIRRNTSHGLPLTLREKRTAAERVLLMEPSWSDRKVAELCGLAHETVGKVRSRLCAGGELRHLDRRIGRDGRYQVVRAPSRTLPSSSNEPHLPERSAGGGLSLRCVGAGARGAATARSVEPQRDAAFTSTSAGSTFAAWFESEASASQWESFVDAVPLSRIYEIADESARRSEAWNRFATALTARVGSHRSRR